MCGRFSLSLSPSRWTEYFGLDRPPEFEARYNIAPGQDIPALRDADGRRALDLLRWGLIPPWARDASIGSRMINARMETLAEKPSFRNAFRSRRCVIPASGFYEWQKTEKKKRPYFVFRADGKPLAFAGLWERWADRETGETVGSCTIVTTTAGPSLREIHDRMPVILDRSKIDDWLDPAIADPAKLTEILNSAGQVELDRHPVSDYVNRAGNEGRRCVEPVDTRDP